MLNTIKYDALAVFVSPSYDEKNWETGDIKQIHWVQSTSFDIEINRSIIENLGRLDVNESTIIESPYVNLNIEYLPVDGYNENAFGLVIDGVSGAFYKTLRDTREYYIQTDSYGENKVFAIGHGHLVNYAVNCQINDVLRSSIQLKGYYIKLDSDTSGNYTAEINKSNGNPINQYTYALPLYNNGTAYRSSGVSGVLPTLSAKDIILNIPTGSIFGADANNKDIHAQSFDISVNIPRNQRLVLGKKYPEYEDIDFPISVDLSVTFLASNYTRELLLPLINKTIDEISITALPQCSCCPTVKYILRGSKFMGQSSSSSVQQRGEINAKWRVNIGDIKNLEKNFFISGSFK